MSVRFYNTLSKSKQEFTPLSGTKAGIYACGPTVYSYAHIGNFRAFLAWDVLRRVLERNKYKVTHIMNITDVGHLQSDADHTEDKMEQAAREEKKTPQQVAEFYTKTFIADMEKLRMLSPSKMPRATDHIPDMIKLIQKLEKKGYTYLTNDAVYFDVSKFKNYGKLSRQSLDDLKAVREDVKRDKGKKHPADFRLWQLNQPEHAMQWDSPWGKGYPGWHIECSAMSMKYLGETLDIHTGGMDHIPIHHTNEIAQSEAATGKKYVNYWLHNAFIQIDKSKMAKSLKNIYTIADLEKKGFSALDFRYLTLTTHYRSELNFTWESLEVAKVTRGKWNEFIRRLQKYSSAKSQHKIKEELAEIKEKVDAFLQDDLNTPQALAALADLQRKANAWMEKNEISKADTRQILSFLQDVDKVFAVFDFVQEDAIIPASVMKLAQDRESARQKKDWKAADTLRDKIEKAGFKVVDTKDGFEVVPL